MSAAQRRVCLFAQFNPAHRIRPHVLGYLAALRECGFETVIACSGDRLPPYEDRHALREAGATVVYRPNRGLDFGAWRHLIRDGHADGADAVLLANDSVFGPFAPLAPILSRMAARRYDVWGMIESWQHRWHLQSWFIHFTGDAFRSKPIQDLFAQPFERMRKDEVVARGELGLGAALEASGLRCGAVVGRRQATYAARRHPCNLMHLDWRYNLLSGRMPFLKADLLRTNAMQIPWATQWDSLLRQRLGVATDTIHDYLFEYTGRVRDDPNQKFETPVQTLPIGVLAAYILSSRDHRQALRSFLNCLTTGNFAAKS